MSIDEGRLLKLNTKEEGLKEESGDIFLTEKIPEPYIQQIRTPNMTRHSQGVSKREDESGGTKVAQVLKEELRMNVNSRAQFV